MTYFLTKRGFRTAEGDTSMARNGSVNSVLGVFSFFFVILSLATSAVGLTSRMFSLNQNQILYLFSTSAQVLAAIYGLTLTGFVFLRNELSREEFEDDTLTEAVESLKRRYFTFLLFITLLVLPTFLLAYLAMSIESHGDKRVTALLINFGQSAYASSLLAISYFVFDVISPKRIERASRSLQDKFDPDRRNQPAGSLEQFLRSYNQIEQLLAEHGRDYRTIALSPSEPAY